jgi:hypothetical protein
MLSINSWMVEDFKLIILYSICYVAVQPHKSIKITNIDIYFLYQIRHVQQRYEGLSVVNIPLILFTIHVIGVFLFKKKTSC